MTTYLLSVRDGQTRYVLGNVPAADGGQHAVVAGLLTMAGNNSAAIAATMLLQQFPSVRTLLMVGIAAGVPNVTCVEDHVRLGDIVVSDGYGVFQYDFIKDCEGELTYRALPRPPGATLLAAVRHLAACELQEVRPWDAHIEAAAGAFGTRVVRPPAKTDVLYEGDASSEPVKHPRDPRRKRGKPRVFSGLIGSGNVVQRNAATRDLLRKRFRVKAIEMEGSGIADATWNAETVSYLVIRGICDYADSYKNDTWQHYAAVAAAAYARALLEALPAYTDVRGGSGGKPSPSGILDSVYTNRDRPEEISKVMRTVGRVLNADEDGIHRVADTTGRITYQLSRPLRYELDLDESVTWTQMELERNALQRQETVVAGPAGIGGVRIYHGDDLLATLPGGGQLSVRAVPLLPPIRSALEIAGTTARLDNLSLAFIPLAPHQLRITNARQEHSPYLVTIDISETPSERSEDDIRQDITIAVAIREGSRVSVRQYLAFVDVQQAIAAGRTVMLRNADTDTVFFDADVRVPYTESQQERDLLEAARTIGLAFPSVDFVWPARLDAVTYHHIQLLAEIVRTGSARVPVKETITAHVTADAVSELLAAAGDGPYRFMAEFAGTRYAVFDRSVELGPRRECYPPLILCPDEATRLAALPSGDRESVIDVAFAIADQVPEEDRCVVFAYPHFGADVTGIPSRCDGSTTGRDAG